MIKENSMTNKEVYNEAIDDVLAALEKRNGKAPCGCCELRADIGGYYSAECTCGNYDDCASAAAWCDGANSLITIRAMKK